MTANEQKFSFQMKFDSLFDFSAPEYDDRHISYLLTEAQWRVFIRRYNPFADKYQKGFEADEQRRRDLEQLIRSVTIDGQLVTNSVRTIATAALGASEVIIEPDPLNLTKPSTWGLYTGQPIDIHGAEPNAQYTDTDTKVVSVMNNNLIKLSKPLIKAIPGEGVEISLGLGCSISQGGAHKYGVFLDLPEGFLYAIEEAAKLKTSVTESWVKPVKHDQYLSNINNPFKKPYKDIIWRMDIARENYAEGNVVGTSKRTELILTPFDDSSTNPINNPLMYYRVRYLTIPPAIVCNEFDATQQQHCILDETLHREIVDEAVAIAQASVKKEDYQVGLSEQQRSQ